jgi:hypothetical protein
LSDCEKLASSGFNSRLGILIFGYDYPDWPMKPAIEAFEVLAAQRFRLDAANPVLVEGLVHPVHRRGAVYAWQINR